METTSSEHSGLPTARAEGEATTPAGQLVGRIPSEKGAPGYAMRAPMRCHEGLVCSQCVCTGAVRRWDQRKQPAIMLDRFASQTSSPPSSERWTQIW